MSYSVIYIAAGCFWGTQEVFREAYGIISTVVGYANSDVNNPTYQQVCAKTTNATEAVKIKYDNTKISLK